MRNQPALPAPAKTNKNPADKLNALSGMRFFLVMGIAIGHFVGVYLDDFPGWVGKVATSYYFCTSTFFVLSGFVLAYVYFDGRRGIRIPDGRFWVARLSKIYPLHLIFVLLLTPAFLKHGQQAAIAQGLQPGGLLLPAMYLSQVFALDAWNPFIVSVNLPAWSVSALCFFYLVFPAFCRRIKSAPLSRLYTWALLLWAAYLVCPAVYTLLDLDKSPHAVVYNGLLHHNPLLRLPEFLIGVLAARIFMVHRENGVEAFYDRIPPSVAVAVALLAWTVLPGFVPHALLHNGLFLPVQLLLILALAGGRDTVTRFFSHPVPVRLGNASLTIFISHYFILGWWGRVDQGFRFILGQLSHGWPGATGFMESLYRLKGQQSNPSFASFLVGLAVLVVASLQIQRYFVDPLSRWLRRKHERKTADRQIQVTQPLPKEVQEVNGPS